MTRSEYGHECDVADSELLFVDEDLVSHRRCWDCAGESSHGCLGSLGSPKCGVKGVFEIFGATVMVDMLVGDNAVFDIRPLEAELLKAGDQYGIDFFRVVESIDQNDTVAGIIRPGRYEVVTDEVEPVKW